MKMSQSSCRTNCVHSWAPCHRNNDTVFLEAQHRTYLRPNPVPSKVCRKVIDINGALLRCSFPPNCIILICFLILYWSWMYMFLDQRVFLSCKFTVLWKRGPWFIIRGLNLKVNYRYLLMFTDSSQLLFETAQYSTDIYSKTHCITIWTSPNLKWLRLKIIFDWS